MHVDQAVRIQIRRPQFISSLQEGDVLNDYFLAARKDLREQSNGSKFLGMVWSVRHAIII